MSIWSWLVLVCFIIIAGIYTYDYFTLPSIDNINEPNNCILANETDTFGLFKQADYDVYLPKDWPFVSFDVRIPNTNTFGINKNDNSEFLSIWASDYNKNTDALIIDTLTPFTNYTIDSKTTIKTNEGEEFTKVIISFKTDLGITKQELYALVKDGKGYLIIARVKTFNYNSFLETLNKITCSFKIN